MPKGPSPYKGHPKSEWPAIKADLEQQRKNAAAATQVNAQLETASVEHPQPALGVSLNIDEQVIPPNLFSGDQKNLEVMSPDGDAQNPIPGFYLYWMNDTDVRIAKAIRSGYQFVERNEVMLNDGLVAGDDVAGNHVRKLVGGNADGKPLYAYLMKKPDWIKKAHDLEYQKVNERLQDMVDRGRLSRNPGQDRQYVRDGSTPTNLPANERSSTARRS